MLSDEEPESSSSDSTPGFCPRGQQCLQAASYWTPSRQSIPSTCTEHDAGLAPQPSQRWSLRKRRFFVIQIKYRKVSWLGPSAATTPRGKTGSAGEISSVLPTATADTSATLHAFSIGFGESGAACAAMGRTGQHQPAKLKSNAQSWL